MMPGIRLCYSPNFSALPFQLEAEQVCFDFSFGIPITKASTAITKASTAIIKTNYNVSKHS